jgi:hypothetical protein
MTSVFRRLRQAPSYSNQPYLGCSERGPRHDRGGLVCLITEFSQVYEHPHCSSRIIYEDAACFVTPAKHGRLRRHTLFWTRTHSHDNATALERACSCLQLYSSKFVTPSRVSHCKSTQYRNNRSRMLKLSLNAISEKGTRKALKNHGETL